MKHDAKQSGDIFNSASSAHAFDGHKLKIRLAPQDDTAYLLRLYTDGNEIASIDFSAAFSPMAGIEYAKLADFDNNGLTDIKILGQGGGNGLAGMVNNISYLMQYEPGRFSLISFMAFGDFAERDFNDDGAYEIVTMDNQQKETAQGVAHSYWIINAYSLTARQGLRYFSSEKYPFPYVYRMLNNSGNKPAAQLSRKTQKSMKLDLPEYYEFVPNANQ